MKPFFGKWMEHTCVWHTSRYGLIDNIFFEDLESRWDIGGTLEGTSLSVRPLFEDLRSGWNMGAFGTLEGRGLIDKTSFLKDPECVWDT
jgi:hypothetical protein